ncbi:hypothetical protein BD779DRAFT_758915 [Infundibulicybe gibba]|nr:hypothetical protein BD779DRAFT_758915 [Infundibulicybe gibba]
MSSSRIQPPSVNLKERIAALQQRNVSLSQRPVTTNAASVSTVASSGSGLRDKIAKFERKGGVPVPRGSFGLGAPPPSDNPQLRKKGELYGNRIPGSLRVTSGGPPLSRSSSHYHLQHLLGPYPCQVLTSRTPLRGHLQLHPP